MYWLEVSVVTDGEAAEAVAEALRPFATGQSVVLEQAGDPHDLDPYALEPEVTVKIYLSAAEDTPAVRHRIAEVLYHLGRLYPIPAPTFRKLEDKDWAHAWKEHYHPFRVGRRIWIQPSWIAGAAPENDDITLVLDPGMAFGTGLHPTTQMCLQAVERLVRPDWRVLDVGTGSGILAIAAAKLGAARVLGIDNDAQAVSAAKANVEQNRVDETVTITAGTLAAISPGTWDLVLVNILAPVILTLLKEQQLLAHVAPAGHLVLSGIIDQQLSDVIQAVHAAGGQIVETITVRDWVTLIAGWA